MNCVACNKYLEGGLDTYGEIRQEMCRDCFFGLSGEEISWYGLAPHRHMYDPDGNIIIGGTRFLPLPDPQPDGTYLIDGLEFVPDPDAPNCGIWTRR